MNTSHDRPKKGVPRGENASTTDWYEEGKKHFQTCLIEISKIDPTQQMVRAGMDDDHVIELSNSMARHGLLEPIVVRKQDNGYVLIAGYHRLMAAKRLGWTLITSTILEESNETPTRSLALIENIVRRDLSIQEEIAALRRLTDEDKLSISQICDLLGRSREWVVSRLEADNYPEKLKEALFEGMISLKACRKIAEVQDEGVQNQILQQAIYQKLPYYTICELVQVYKENPTIQHAVEAGVEAARQIQTAPPPTRRCDGCGSKLTYSDLMVYWLCSQCAQPAHIEQET